MEFKQLWQEYSNQLRQFLLSRVNNQIDVDDLLQEILIKTYQNLNSIKEQEKLLSWLFQIARNTLIDYYRKSSLDTWRQRIAGEEMLIEGEPQQYEQVRQELTNCIRPFLNQLPPKYREAIEAVDLQGISQKELAIELGLSYSALKSRVQRGRNMLKAMFDQCCHYKLDARGNLIDFDAKSSSCRSC
ncbi:MAG: RNA polymerase sigma factor SigZ [Symploca sp. SIO3C6]|nr:RNA polymerase sigma factor SigZ [Symploca sp. SIO3C6]